jgi:hypothetical protein
MTTVYVTVKEDDGQLDIRVFKTNGAALGSLDAQKEEVLDDRRRGDAFGRSDPDVPANLKEADDSDYFDSIGIYFTLEPCEVQQ